MVWWAPSHQLDDELHRLGFKAHSQNLSEPKSLIWQRSIRFACPPQRDRHCLRPWPGAPQTRWIWGHVVKGIVSPNQHLGSANNANPKLRNPCSLLGVVANHTTSNWDISRKTCNTQPSQPPLSWSSPNKTCPAAISTSAASAWLDTASPAGGPQDDRKNWDVTSRQKTWWNVASMEVQHVSAFFGSSPGLFNKWWPTTTVTLW